MANAIGTTCAIHGVAVPRPRPAMRIPAADFEQAVLNELRALLGDERRLIELHQACGHEKNEYGAFAALARVHSS